MERQAKLQEEQAAMAESLKNMQKKINEEKSIWLLQTSCLYCRYFQKLAIGSCEGQRENIVKLILHP